MCPNTPASSRLRQSTSSPDLVCTEPLTLQGLARLLELLSDWFNLTLGDKLLEHLKNWLNPEKQLTGQVRGI